jgi:hypothetical protein
MQSAIEVLLDSLRSGRLSRMVANNYDCYIDDNLDTVTVMNDNILPELPSPSDTRYQRAIS